jgi:arylsulfatase
MAYSFDNAKAKETHTTQYFEMFGNRGIYHDGWIAATRHSIPWVQVQNPPLTKDVWELYHVREDFSQAHDLAAKDPAKLKEMQALFMKEAIRNHVLSTTAGLSDSMPRSRDDRTSWEAARR